MLPSESVFIDEMKKLDVRTSDIVVVYDTQMGHWAARGWWMLHAYGHKNVFFLDGGIKKWQAEGLEVSKEAEKFELEGGEFNYKLDESTVTNLEKV